MNANAIIRVGLSISFFLVIMMLPMQGQAETHLSQGPNAKPALGLKYAKNSPAGFRPVSTISILISSLQTRPGGLGALPQDRPLSKRLFSGTPSHTQLGLQPDFGKPLNDEDSNGGPSLGGTILVGLGFCAIVFIILVLAGTVEVKT